MLAAPHTAALRSNPDTLAVALQAMYEFAAYRSARHAATLATPEERTLALHSLLGIDLSTAAGPGAEPFTDDVPFVCEELDYAASCSRAASLVWMPRPHGFLAIARFAAEDFRAPVGPEALGVDTEALQLAAATSALLCTKDDDRVDRTARVSRLWPLGATEHCTAYVRDISVGVWRADYDGKLNVKRTTEARARLMMQIQTLADASDLNTFLTLLPEVVPHRSSPGFGLLQEALLTGEVPLRADKLWTVLLGRNRAGAVTWVSGNAYQGNYTPYEAVFRNLDPSGELWAELAAVKRAFCRHVYRALPNSKGHSNAKPSYWALGYQTIDLFREGVSPAEWAEYKAVHTTCCGFA